MSTFTLTIDNSANKTTIYTMEDVSGINSPYDLFFPGCFEVPFYNSNLIKRYYLSIAIGGPTFPPVCLEVKPQYSGSLIVSKGTTKLKFWTYDKNDASWNDLPISQDDYTIKNKNTHIKISETEKSGDLYFNLTSSSSSEPASESASEPASESASEPASESASEPASESASEPASESA